ncbi:MAG: DUF268 domain-containing protein [Bacteroidota bacterium]|nr:DUF268 domain-containing protein [Bacteroidota bacterium]
MKLKTVFRFITSFAILNFQFERTIFKIIPRYFSLMVDYLKFIRKGTNASINYAETSILPELFDKTSTTPIEPIYFYQSSWLAEMLAKTKPKMHYDVGSSVNALGVTSQFVPITMIDIRPPEVQLPELQFIKGSIIELPFANNSIESLSSICVIEHIGLGRYGDPIDPFGSEKAAKELSRVLAEKGNLYITVPVFKINKLYYNAHRAFTRQGVLDIFKGLTLVEERYQYGNATFSNYDPDKGFGTGYFYFTKI